MITEPGNHKRKQITIFSLWTDEIHGAIYVFTNEEQN